MPVSGSAARRISMARSLSVMRGMDPVSFMGSPGLREERAHFLVAGLREILVPEPHRMEGLRGGGAHDFVGCRAPLLAGVTRSGADGDADGRGLQPAAC